MASLQFNLEDKSRMDSKYKKQIQNLQAKIANADQRFARDEEFLLRLKDRMKHMEDRRPSTRQEKSWRCNTRRPGKLSATSCSCFGFTSVWVRRWLFKLLL